MKTLELNTTSKKVVMFMYCDAWNEKQLSKKLDVSEQTISHRIKHNDWRFDELNALRKLFKERGYKF